MQLVAQQRALRRRARLWAPPNARRCLATLEVEGREPVETVAINRAPSQHWGQVFRPAIPPD
eukprot:8828434-Pyramimonas_sp.AAC.1